MKYNLLRISHLCDRGLKVIFESSICIVSKSTNNGIKFIGYKHDNIYMIDLDDLSMENIKCWVAIKAKVDEANWIWYHWLRHTSMDLIVR